jgi:hypothetical protein
MLAACGGRTEFLDPCRSKTKHTGVTVPKELLDQLVKGPMTQSDLESTFRELKKAVIELATSAKMNEHRGYRQGESKPEGQT